MAAMWRMLLEAAAGFERVAHGGSLKLGARAGVEGESAVAQRLVADRLDGPAEIASGLGDGDPVDRDVVAHRRLVCDGDGSDQLRGAAGVADAVPATAVALPDRRADVPDSTAAYVAQAELLDDRGG